MLSAQTYKIFTLIYKQLVCPWFLGALKFSEIVCKRLIYNGFKLNLAALFLKKDVLCFIQVCLEYDRDMYFVTFVDV
jgi:hypothetical protein